MLHFVNLQRRLFIQIKYIVIQAEQFVTKKIGQATLNKTKSNKIVSMSHFVNLQRWLFIQIKFIVIQTEQFITKTTSRFHFCLQTKIRTYLDDCVPFYSDGDARTEISRILQLKNRQYPAHCQFLYTVIESNLSVVCNMQRYRTITVTSVYYSKCVCPIVAV